MPKSGVLVVEGPHDVEFVCRLLKPFRLQRIQMIDDVDPFFKRLVPPTFPHGGDLLRRVPVPLFVQSATHSIAIHTAIGDSRLVQTLDETRQTIDLDFSFESLSGAGIILDSDNAVAPANRYNDIKAAMSDKGFQLPADPGKIATGTPRLGAFVLPDNQAQGTLEDLLIECANKVYPNLLQSAEAHVANATADATLTKPDLKDLGKPAGTNKAIIGAMASVLRPGKAIQVSIQDNRWLCADSLKLKRLKAVQDFLANLFELTVP